MVPRRPKLTPLNDRSPRWAMRVAIAGKKLPYNHTCRLLEFGLTRFTISRCRACKTVFDGRLDPLDGDLSVRIWWTAVLPLAVRKIRWPAAA